MPEFGRYKTLRQLSSTLGTTLWLARDPASGKEVVVKHFRPDPAMLGEAGAREAAAAFLRRARHQQQLHANDPAGWAAVQEAAGLGDEAYGVVPHYPRSAQKLIWGKVRLQPGELHALISAVLTALAEVPPQHGAGHGKLKPSNILMGPGRSLAEAAIVLTDPADPQQGRCGAAGRDLVAIGELIYRLVVHPPGGRCIPCSVEPGEGWDALGPTGPRWREFCQSLLRARGPDEPVDFRDYCAVLAEFCGPARERTVKAPRMAVSRRSLTSNSADDPRPVAAPLERADRTRLQPLPHQEAGATASPSDDSSGLGGPTRSANSAPAAAAPQSSPVMRRASVPKGVFGDQSNIVSLAGDPRRRSDQQSATDLAVSRSDLPTRGAVLQPHAAPTRRGSGMETALPPTACPDDVVVKHPRKRRSLVVALAASAAVALPLAVILFPSHLPKLGSIHGGRLSVHGAVGAAKDEEVAAQSPGELDARRRELDAALDAANQLRQQWDIYAPQLPSGLTSPARELCREMDAFKQPDANASASQVSAALGEARQWAVKLTALLEHRSMMQSAIEARDAARKNIDAARQASTEAGMANPPGLWKAESSCADGDRQLSGGDFANAWQCYTAAMLNALYVQRAALGSGEHRKTAPQAAATPSNEIKTPSAATARAPQSGKEDTNQLEEIRSRVNPSPDTVASQLQTSGHTGEFGNSGTPQSDNSGRHNNRRGENRPAVDQAAMQADAAGAKLRQQDGARYLSAHQPPSDEQRTRYEALKGQGFTDEQASQIIRADSHSGPEINARQQHPQQERLEVLKRAGYTDEQAAQIMKNSR